MDRSKSMARKSIMQGKNENKKNLNMENIFVGKKVEAGNNGWMGVK